MKWISVTDKLPLNQEDVKNYASIDVIVATRCGEVMVMEFVMVKEFAMGNAVTPWSQFGDTKDGWITHWMPMPEPPKGGEE